MEEKRQSKRIIGVPVMPGLAGIHVAPAPTPKSVIEDDVHQMASSAESSPGIPRARLVSTPRSTPEETVVVSAGERRKTWKLGHVDFFPNTSEKSKKEDDFEPFPKLIARANDWLKRSPYASLFCAETVTWMTVDRPVFTDNGILTKSMHTDKKTRVFRGLRVWYHTTDDTFYSERTSSQTLVQIGFQDYTIDQKSDSLKMLLNNVNMALIDKPIYGKTMRAETLNVPTDVGETESCFWREEPQKDRNYMTFLRLLFVTSSADEASLRCTDIGLQDFLPKFNQRSPHNQGYETYEEVWRRVARWMHDNPALKYINLQSVYVKFKKDATEDEMLDRCYYKEHGCAVSSLLHNQRTDYLQVIRVAYTKRRQPSGSPQDPYRPKMSYKTFTPSRLLKVTSEEDLSENVYEDLGQLEHNINTWIHCTGARLVSIETAPVRMMSGGQGVLGTEATFVNNSREKNNPKELWRVNVRLYLEGVTNDMTTSMFSSRSSAAST